jgi:hypothetical protein
MLFCWSEAASRKATARQAISPSQAKQSQRSRCHASRGCSPATPTQAKLITPLFSRLSISPHTIQAGRKLYAALLLAGDLFESGPAQASTTLVASDASTDRDLGSIAMNHRTLLRHSAYWPPGEGRICHSDEEHSTQWRSPFRKAGSAAASRPLPRRCRCSPQ